MRWGVQQRLQERVDNLSQCFGSSTSSAGERPTWRFGAFTVVRCSCRTLSAPPRACLSPLPPATRRTPYPNHLLLAAFLPLGGEHKGVGAVWLGVEVLL